MVDKKATSERSDRTNLCDSAFRLAVMAAGAAAYHWDLESDRLLWSDNAQALLDVDDPKLLESGTGYAALIDPESDSSRRDAIFESEGRDTGSGVPFCVEYAIRPSGDAGSQPVLVEDCGRWFAGPDGKPVRVLGMVRRINGHHHLHNELRIFGQYDPLTGLMNRSALNAALEDVSLKAVADNAQAAFLIASLDNLAVIADAYGYDTADDVVRIVGRRLRRVARSEDIVARYSDSRFGLILHNCTREDLEVAMERFLSVANERVIETANGPVWAMLSIGAVILPDHARNRDEAIARAEEALAEAADQPLKKGVIHTSEPHRISQRMLNARCAADIVDALRNNHFTLAFQPIVDARTEQPVYHESLLRMRTSDGDIVAAAHLIPIAEKLGLIRLVDFNVVELALETLHAESNARLSVNMSGVTTADARWNARITDLLADHVSVTDRLVVEITETTVMNELDATRDFIERLRELGCKVAIDDFGAGYSSYKNLKLLDADIVKLDGSFCERLSENTENQYFVRSLVDLAHQLGMKVVAEWVQTEADAAMLRDWGVDYLQGHLFGQARIDAPWRSPRLQERPGILTLVEAPEELADLSSPIALPVANDEAMHTSSIDPAEILERLARQEKLLPDAVAKEESRGVFSAFATPLSSEKTTEDVSPAVPLVFAEAESDEVAAEVMRDGLGRTGNADNDSRQGASGGETAEDERHGNSGSRVSEAGREKDLRDMVATLDAELETLKRMLESLRAPREANAASGEGR